MLNVAPSRESAGGDFAYPSALSGFSSLQQEVNEANSLSFRLTYYCATQAMQLSLLTVMIFGIDADQLIIDQTSHHLLGGFPLLTGFTEIYFCFILCRDFIFVTLLLFMHKTIKLALEFRLEMCMIDALIILVLSASCCLVLPMSGRLASAEGAEKELVAYLAPSESFFEVVKSTDFGAVLVLIGVNTVI